MKKQSPSYGQSGPTGALTGAGSLWPYHQVPRRSV